MINKALEDYKPEDIMDAMHEIVDAIVLVDCTTNKYRAFSRKGIFKELLGETGDYHDLIQLLWFHLENSNEEINADYKAFVSYTGVFKGKYSRRVSIFVDGSDSPHIVQISVCPVDGTDKYIFIMDELDDEEYVEEYTTTKKVNTIQNTYLFSMYVDLIRDTTSSISVTEISDEPVNAEISYSQWRLMVVNMIWPEDQKQFLTMTDPEYLKENLTYGRTISYDCMMKNLEGVFIWVKLIFSRAHTPSDEDFRFVYMVQDINENALELMSTLEKYERLALRDSLTGVFNHGGIETEICNAIDVFKKGGDPVSLLMLDLDHFKNINDTFGHSAGDTALKIFADILEASIDGERASVGRWGGEEFVIVLRGRSREDAYTFAENIRKKVEAADFGKVGKITCSIGITQVTEADFFDDAFNRMDKAMYASKEAGRNKVTEM